MCAAVNWSIPVIFGSSLTRGSAARVAAELQPGLLDVVAVKMHVTKAVHELARLEPTDLGHQQRQQGIAGDIEGHSRNTSALR